MTQSTLDPTHELVPVADRLRYLIGFRALVCVMTVVASLLLPVVGRTTGTRELVVMTAWVLGLAAAEAAWRRMPGRALWLFGAMVMADGALLVWLTYVAIPQPTPLRYLVVLHVVAVSLLASHRTGLKVAMWNSLLLLSVFYAGEAGVLHPGGDVHVGDATYRALLLIIGLLWAAALSTSAFSAANERELRRRRYDLEALGKLALSLEHRGDAESVAERLCAAAADDFGFSRVAVFAVADAEVRLLHVLGGTPEGDAHGAVAEQTVLHAAATQTRPLLVSRSWQDTDAVLAAVLPDARNLALVPMRADDRTLGVLVCEHGMRSGSRMERRVLSMLERYASHAALALSNAWLIAELERSARVDALTGVANRRVFDAELARELGRASRSAEPVSLLLLDVDHFKRLNDTFGHVTGDAVLSALGRALADGVRLGDTLARYGGEEFALILPGLDEVSAVEAAERLRERVASLDFDPAITVSIGVATYPAAGRDPLTVLGAADGALYRAKADGRNTVVGHSLKRPPAGADQLA